MLHEKHQLSDRTIEKIIGGAILAALMGIAGWTVFNDWRDIKRDEVQAAEHKEEAMEQLRAVFNLHDEQPGHPTAMTALAVHDAAVADLRAELATLQQRVCELEPECDSTWIIK